MGRSWAPTRRIALLALVSVNVGAFVFQLFTEAAQPGFIRDYLALSERGILSAYSWQFITAPLLYGGAWHFFGSVVVLYFLGRDIESILGQRHFVYLFLSGAIGGELGHLFLMPAETLLYAASGGIAAIVIAYATLLPEIDFVEWRSRFFTIHLKAKHVAYAVVFVSLVMLMVDRHGAVTHSAIPGGLIVGWLYVHLLGFGHPSWVQRWLWSRRVAEQRIERMTFAEFVHSELDPVLEKISRTGIGSLSRAEKRILARTRDKVG
jgi:membrane associated rhomboid family serine protease